MIFLFLVRHPPGDDSAPTVIVADKMIMVGGGFAWSKEGARTKTNPDSVGLESALDRSTRRA